jgi:hypothetical protein
MSHRLASRSLWKTGQDCAEVIECFKKRWENQMEQKLYGAALYLNPGKFFALRDKDRRQAPRLRSMFNDVSWKVVSDDDEQTKISKQADDYERSKGECFSKPGAIRDRDRKNPSMLTFFWIWIFEQWHFFQIVDD